MNKLKITILIFSSFFILGFNYSNFSDCSPTTFNQLIRIQEAKSIDKEDTILELGYSFTGVHDARGETFRVYENCNERITYNKKHNAIGYSTYDSKHYISLKNSVKSLKGCIRKKEQEFDIYENCNNGFSYLFSILYTQGKSIYQISIQPN